MFAQSTRMDRTRSTRFLCSAQSKQVRSPGAGPKLFALFLFLCAIALPAVSAQCTVCADGTTTPNGSFGGGTDCSLIADSIAMTPATDPECGMVQLNGFMYCACPTFPTDQYCSLCDYTTSSSGSNGTASYQSLEPYQSAVIPTLGDTITCQDVEFLPVSNEQCGSTALQEAAWFCGCGGEKRGQCYLCGSATAATPNNRNLPPPLDSKTCADVDREGGLYYNINAGECEELMLGDVLPSTFDYKSYCGCVGNGEVPNTCSLCGADSSVQNPDASLSDESSGMTCAELEMAAPYILDSDYCSELQDQYADRCCNPAPPPTPTTATAEPPAAPAPSGADDSGADESGGDDSENPAPVAAPTSPAPPAGTSSAAVAGMTLVVGLIPILLNYGVVNHLQYYT